MRFSECTLSELKERLLLTENWLVLEVGEGVFLSMWHNADDDALFLTYYIMAGVLGFVDNYYIKIHNLI